MSHVVITGAGVGNTANRLEINDFVKDEKFFSLYIQALRKSTTNCHRPVNSIIFFAREYV